MLSARCPFGLNGSAVLVSSHRLFVTTAILSLSYSFQLGTCRLGICQRPSTSIRHQGFIRRLLHLPLHEPRPLTVFLCITVVYTPALTLPPLRAGGQRPTFCFLSVCAGAVCECHFVLSPLAGARVFCVLTAAFWVVFQGVTDGWLLLALAGTPAQVSPVIFAMLCWCYTALLPGSGGAGTEL